MYSSDSSIDVIYKKLGDGGEAEAHATVANVKAAFEDAISKNPSLLIFHFSDHGGPEGYICLEDGDMYNTEVFNYFS